jgi:hypothetical protein
MSYSITKLLHEGKAFGTRTRKVIDLRSLEAKAYAIVHKHEYPKIVTRQTGIATKNLVGVKRKLRAALGREVRSWKKEQIEFSTLIRRSRNFIETAYKEAYLHGLRSQGHGALRGVRGTKLSPTDQLTREDLAWIKSAAEEEMTYWHRFMRTMRKDYEEIEKIVYDPVTHQQSIEVERIKREYITDQQQRRLNMYVNAVDSVFDSGKVQGAGEFTLIDWVLGDAEHCPECLYLEGQSPYTKDSLPCTPRSGCTRCLSNCKCKLVLTGVDSTRYAQFIRREKPSSYYLRQLARSRKLSRGLPEVAGRLVKAEARSRVQKAKAVSRRSR